MQLKSSELLLNIRIVFSSFVVAHLVYAAIVLLSIDLTQDEDPKISAYGRLRWRLLTCWFNLFMLLYFPVTIYCDWKQKMGKWDSRRVTLLRTAKDTLMTSIIFPTTTYSDYFFWRMWHQDPTLIGPEAVFNYMPSWGQHSLHTLSGLTVILDILLTPRRRPKSILPGLSLTFAFCVVYTLVLIISYYNGDVVYNLIEIFNKQQLILLVLLAFLEHTFFYTLQWCIIDTVHGKLGKNIQKYD
ncbi:Androgen-dependent TPF1-regulating protein [Danaus plexippus plexippus]|uniref:Androgen-dependent TPF1-regulating protein n=1 Tax=Danaus plexippus plexippus TaxID=278856 RepID=A0A212FPH7_DANPL|nr:Androgen-dependent TPF1-regulating protein [Danaus plexippus plexippus]